MSILYTAQSIMDPNLPDGVHDWRPGLKFRKEGYKVVIDGTNTLAGRSVVVHVSSGSIRSIAYHDSPYHPV